MLREKVSEMLVVKLTLERLCEVSQQLVSSLDDCRKLEFEAKETANQFKAKIQVLKEEIDKLKSIVRSGDGETLVECEKVIDLQKRYTWFEFEGTRYNERELYDDEIGKLERKMFDNTQES
jgi:iron uptake system EfeUOB component EfeO/EfeM